MTNEEILTGLTGYFSYQPEYYIKYPIRTWIVPHADAEAIIRCLTGVVPTEDRSILLNQLADMVEEMGGRDAMVADLRKMGVVDRKWIKGNNYQDQKYHVTYRLDRSSKMDDDYYVLASYMVEK